AVERIHYATGDPHFRNLVEELTPLQVDLANLRTEVATVLAARPGEFEAQFKTCMLAISIAGARAKSAATAKDFQQYGLISALLSVDFHEDRLGRVTRACNRDLDTALGNTAAADSPQAKVEGHRQTMEREFALIDKAGAAYKANAEMPF